MLQLSKVQNHFNRYLQVGGFLNWPWPTTTFWPSRSCGEDVVDKVLKRDLPSLLQNPQLQQSWSVSSCISAMFLLKSSQSRRLQRNLNGVSRPTVENYIAYLESANLIYQSWPVNMAGKKVLKASPKIYIADAAIRNAVLRTIPC